MLRLQMSAATPGCLFSLKSLREMELAIDMVFSALGHCLTLCKEVLDMGVTVWAQEETIPERSSQILVISEGKITPGDLALLTFFSLPENFGLNEISNYFI
jgi:hypothetical protein